MRRLLPLLLIAALAMCCLPACSKVEAGNVGVKVHLLGSDKGVDSEELGPGRYFIGFNEDLYIFPTFAQTATWTKNPTEGSPADESITFQTKEGLSVGADVGITYAVNPAKVNILFQKYRRGLDEITAKYLRNMVRDAFVAASSTKPVESVYGTGKSALLKEVEAMVRSQVEPIGLNVERIYLVGDLRLPKSVTDALSRKVEATQRAEQRENELREAQAQAAKMVAEAKGKADSKLLEAEAQAKANRVLSESLTPRLVQYKALSQWDGVLPKYMGGEEPVPFLSVAN